MEIKAINGIEKKVSFIKKLFSVVCKIKRLLLHHIFVQKATRKKVIKDKIKLDKYYLRTIKLGLMNHKGEWKRRKTKNSNECVTLARPIQKACWTEEYCKANHISKPWKWARIYHAERYLKQVLNKSRYGSFKECPDCEIIFKVFDEKYWKNSDCDK